MIEGFSFRPAAPNGRDGGTGYRPCHYTFSSWQVAWLRCITARLRRRR
jgi:hypothetical protein